MDAVLNLAIIDGPVPWIVYTLAIAAVICLVARRPTPRWVLTAAIGILAGMAIAVAVYLFASKTKAFGEELPHTVLWWALAMWGAIGLAVVSLWASAVWRKIVAGVGIVLFALSGAIGINAFYGLNPTVGSLLGVVVDNPVDLPDAGSANGAAGARPLYESFTPPADMPTKGTQGTQVIPGTISGFEPRPAGIYLPPAALVPNAPALPLVIMMMGFPGDPNPQYIGEVLDTYAASHNGLAPIVIVADQIGTGNDPACADSDAVGNAETYITKDVVAWAKANLHISDNPKSWVIAGYSNGGGCAIKYAAKDPSLWRNILDISGEEYPGSEDVDNVIATIYHGDKGAFEAAKPINIMAAAPAGTYRGMTAVFTVGGGDPAFIPAAQAVSSAARTAGMTVTFAEIPGAGHIVDGLMGGLEKGFEVLYPVLGLAKP